MRMETNKLIEPRVLKGFRDQLPEMAIPREQMIRKLQDAFQLFGFVPIDTPALEYAEILLGKGGAETDKQLFRFKDQGDRDVAMRFDLTVPLARFAAMHIGKLGTPFKRYHIGTVWRADKPQRGRFREFMQCDFDIIGTSSISADAETLALVSFAFDRLDTAHELRINNRKVLNGLLETLSARDKSVSVMRAIDKLDKLGRETVTRELTDEAQLSAAQIEQLFKFLSLSQPALSRGDLLKELSALIGKNELGARGVTELRELMSSLDAYGINEKHTLIDLSIARGLDYYTGTVFETRFSDLPEIGSIASGGRYDDLASLYTKQHLPGVGGSIGLDRLLAGLEELKKLPAVGATAKVLITILDADARGECYHLATVLRDANIATEVALEDTKLGNQFKYADKKGIRWAIIAGRRELDQKVFNLKNLESGEQTDNLPLSSLVNALRERGV